MRELVLSFVEDLERFVLSLTSRDYRSAYPFGFPVRFDRRRFNARTENDYDSDYDSAEDDEDEDEDAEPEPEDKNKDKSRSPFARDGLACAAAERGATSLFSLVSPTRLTARCARAAARSGQLVSLQSLSQLGSLRARPSALLAISARFAHPHVITWLLTLPGASVTTREFSAACRSGDLAFAQWLWSLPHGLEASQMYNALPMAALSGNLALVEWLLTGSYPKSWSEIVTRAAESNASQVLAHLLALPPVRVPEVFNDCQENLVESAATHDHFELLSWAVDQGCRLHENLFVQAARKPDLRLAEFLHSRKVPWLHSALRQASQRDNTHFVKWAHKVGYPPSPDVISFGARRGNMELVRFAVEEQRVSIPANAIAQAVNIVNSPQNALDMVIYLRKHGAVWDELVATTAARRNLAVFLWLVHNGCPYNLEQVAKRTLNAHSLSALRWALDTGASYRPVFALRAASRGDLSFLAYLLDTQRPLPSHCYAAAVEGRSFLLVVSWLFEHGVEIPSDLLHRVARRKSPLAHYQWALEKGLPLTAEVYIRAAAWNDDSLLPYLEEKGCDLSALEDRSNLRLQLLLRTALSSRSNADNVARLRGKGLRCITNKELTALFLDELRAGHLPTRPHGFKGALELLTGAPKVEFDESPSDSDSDQDDDSDSDLDDSLEPLDKVYRNLKYSQMISQSFLEEDVVHLPSSVSDCRHSHPLILTYQPYAQKSHSPDYNCDVCHRMGSSYSYHCSECHFDVHPGHCEVNKPALFNDPRHAHTLKMTKVRYRHSIPCADCGKELFYWAYSCEGCELAYHPACVQGEGAGATHLLTKAKRKRKEKTRNTSNDKGEDNEDEDDDEDEDEDEESDSD